MKLLLTAAGAALSIAAAPQALADDPAFLDGSTQAIIMGPTDLPPNLPGYMPTIDSLYLEPLGFSPTGTLTYLNTPETTNFGPSVAAGDTILVNTVLADYNAGDLSASDPLTIVGYSQSALIESQAEQTLYADGVPSADLRFVMLGDPAANPATPTGITDTFGNTFLGQTIDNLLGWSNLNDTATPNNLYPTDVYTVQNDFFADWPGASSSPLNLILGNLEHGTYLGLPESAIANATSTTDGLTTYYTIADPPNLEQVMLADNFNIEGLTPGIDALEAGNLSTGLTDITTALDGDFTSVLADIPTILGGLIP